MSLFPSIYSPSKVSFCLAGVAEETASLMQHFHLVYVGIRVVIFLLFSLPF